MNPGEDADIGSTGMEDEFGKGPGSLSNAFEPGTENNADAGTIKDDLSLTLSKQKEKDREKKFDKEFNEKFANPDSFYEQWFNESGPNAEAMETMLEILAEKIDIDKGAGIKPDLLQCDISHELHTFLETKGDMCQERKEFLEDPLAEIRKHEG